MNSFSSNLEANSPNSVVYFGDVKRLRYREDGDVIHFALYQPDGVILGDFSIPSRASSFSSREALEDFIKHQMQRPLLAFNELGRLEHRAEFLIKNKAWMLLQCNNISVAGHLLSRIRARISWVLAHNSSLFSSSSIESELSASIWVLLADLSDLCDLSCCFSEITASAFLEWSADELDLRHQVQIVYRRLTIDMRLMIDSRQKNIESWLSLLRAYCPESQEADQLQQRLESIVNRRFMI